jgi:hypothetical protein
MDIQKLITMGKMEKDVTYDEITFHLVTPTSDELSRITDNVDLLAAFIVKIGDKEFVKGEDKEGLKTVLRSMQGVLIGNLVKKAAALMEQQDKTIEGMSKK